MTCLRDMPPDSLRLTYMFNPLSPPSRNPFLSEPLPHILLKTPDPSLFFGSFTQSHHPSVSGGMNPVKKEYTFYFLNQQFFN